MKISTLLVLTTLVTVAYSEYNKKLKEHETSLDDHYDTDIILENIASLYHNHNKHEKSLEYFEKSLKILIHIYNKNTNNDNILSRLGRIGSSDLKIDDKNEALKILEEAFEISQHIEDDDSENGVHRDIASIMINMTKSFLESYDYNYTLEPFNVTFDMFIHIYDFEDNSNFATLFSNIGLIYEKLGEYELAIIYYQKSVKVLKNINGDYEKIAFLLIKVAKLYVIIDDSKETIKLTNEAFKILSSSDKWGYQSIVNSLKELAIQFHDFESYEISLYYYNLLLKSLRVINENKYHSEILSTLGTVGELYLKTQNYKDALKTFEEALEIGHKDKDDFIVLFNNVGIAHYFLNEYEKALEFFEKSFKMSKNIHENEHHPVIVAISKNIKSAKDDLRKKQQKQEF
jgi:tetratricopeptide (TPR) repeat protein